MLVVLDGGLVAARPSLTGEIQSALRRHVHALDVRGEPFVLPGGEAAKNDPALVAALLARFAEAKLDRHATVIAVGGGAVLDAAGYAAATAHRGIRLLRVPSTVLAQCGTWVVFRLTSDQDLKAVASAGEWVDRQELHRIAGLPRQQAVVFGSSVTMPVRVVAPRADPRPKSADPDFSRWAGETPPTMQPYELDSDSPG